MRRADEMARGGADGGIDSNRFGASGSIGERAAEAQEGSAGTALVAVSEDASGVNGAASCVRLRSCLPAPMYTCVCLSRKSNAINVDDHAETKNAFWMRASAQIGLGDARRRRRVKCEILPLFALGARAAWGELTQIE